jgi:hypothetical protein
MQLNADLRHSRIPQIKDLCSCRSTACFTVVCQLYCSVSHDLFQTVKYTTAQIGSHTNVLQLPFPDIR